jgi:hypothetical protein
MNEMAQGFDVQHERWDDGNNRTESASSDEEAAIV